MSALARILEAHGRHLSASAEKHLGLWEAEQAAGSLGDLAPEFRRVEKVVAACAAAFAEALSCARTIRRESAEAVSRRRAGGEVECRHLEAALEREFEDWLSAIEQLEAGLEMEDGSGDGALEPQVASALQSLMVNFKSAPMVGEDRLAKVLRGVHAQCRARPNLFPYVVAIFKARHAELDAAAQRLERSTPSEEDLCRTVAAACEEISKTVMACACSKMGRLREAVDSDLEAVRAGPLRNFCEHKIALEAVKFVDGLRAILTE